MCSTIDLYLPPTGVIHVIAETTAKGDCMNTATEETGTAQTTAENPKASKKARVARQRAHVAPNKSKSAKKAKASKKAPKSAKSASVARDGSKAAKVLDLLKGPDGATLAELMKATGWQAHSVRGFLSGTVGKKMGLTVASAKPEGDERRYSVKARLSPISFASRRQVETWRRSFLSSLHQLLHCDPSISIAAVIELKTASLRPPP
jgi:hypothetical protein